jgi:hypothetical protein
MGTFIRRLLALVRRNRLERDLDDELSFHLSMREAEQQRPGLSPTQAPNTVRRQFGNVLRIKEQSRDAWLFAWFESVLQDVQFALRGLRRAPGFTAVVILTLALGIGATTAIFSVVSATLLRPLPYPDAVRLVRIIENVPAEESATEGPVRTSEMNQDAFLWWRDQTRTLSNMAAFVTSSITALIGSETVRLTDARVSPSLFELLGARAIAGRTLIQADEQAPNVAVLAAATWRRYFASDPAIVGRAIVLEGVPHTIVGVMGPTIAFPSAYTEIWTPFRIQTSTPNRLMPVSFGSS